MLFRLNNLTWFLYFLLNISRLGCFRSLFYYTVGQFFSSPCQINGYGSILRRFWHLTEFEMLTWHFQNWLFTCELVRLPLVRNGRIWYTILGMFMMMRCWVCVGSLGSCFESFVARFIDNFILIHYLRLLWFSSQIQFGHQWFWFGRSQVKWSLQRRTYFNKRFVSLKSSFWHWLLHLNRFV